MFGKNPIRSQVRSDGQRLWVQEIFHTIQGEGPLQGHPAIFLRLGGCNLRCFWCDTDFESSAWKPNLDEVTAKIKKISDETGTKQVILTGGEPFRQNIGPLLMDLLGIGIHVQIETNGTLWVDIPEHPNLSIVCSPKTPTLNDKLRRRATAFKYVIGAEDLDAPDGLPTLSTQIKGKKERMAKAPKDVPIYISPRDDCNSDKNAANMRACVEIAMKKNYILSVQLHKIIGVD